MNATIKTKNTTYFLRDGDKLGTSYLSGGRYNDLEIHTPSNVEVGQELKFIATDNPKNGSYANQMGISTRIKDIQPHHEKDTEYIFNAGDTSYKLTPVQDNPKVMLLTSAGFAGLEVETPDHTPLVGERLFLTFTQNPINGKKGGSFIGTQPIQSIDKIIGAQMIQSPVASKQLSMTTGRNDRPIMQEQPLMQEQSIYQSMPNAVNVESNTNVPTHLNINETAKVSKKNPFASMVAFARNKLTYQFHTSHSTYTLTPVPENDSVMMLSGGVIPFPLEVVKPSSMPNRGERLMLTYTSNPANGKFANRQFASSKIQMKTFCDEANNVYSSAEVNGYQSDNGLSSNIEALCVDTNHSRYVLTAVPGKKDIMNFIDPHNNVSYEIYKPRILPVEGERLNLQYTDNPMNGDRANNVISTSPVQSVNKKTSHDTDKAVSFSDEPLKDAGKFFVRYTGQSDKDFGTLLQNRMSDITSRAAETLGLPEDTKQEIYFTPSKSIGTGGSLFEVSFSGFPSNAESLKVIQQVVYDEISSNGCAYPQFGSQTSVGKQEFDMMRESLSETGLGIDKQNSIMKAIADMERNYYNSKNELRSALSTPYVPEKSDTGMQL